MRRNTRGKILIGYHEGGNGSNKVKNNCSKLKEFELDLQCDIIANTTDGCSMMRKVGRLLPTLHQLCHAHGLQLVIHDIFYQKQTTQSEYEINSNYSTETEEYDELGDKNGLDIVEQYNALMENVSIGDVAIKFGEL